MGVITILAGWVKHRYARQHLLINLVTYAWFPLIAGIRLPRARRRDGDRDGQTSASTC